ncbi:MAG TPA: thiamine pyrophosphate-dependent enzyme, partial [Fusibacter sp.]|nr:thiamine pyrophosphate-dependent enzyme [Fusibacter sp.]
EGKGPAWANSLFEDNAEYGYGMNLGVKAIKATMVEKFKALIDMNIDANVTAAFSEWLETKEDAEASKASTAKVLEILENNTVTDPAAKELLNYAYNHKDYLIKRSIWILGGDGWAYDIGFGGLDHVIASGENVNILVFDTEIYSNTGGQASKSTPVAAIAKFASSGMRVKKKDLGMIATTYGYVYVAQVSMGANQNQFLKVIQEAESYDGPSLIICYAPCISHGIKTGMGTTQRRMKEAVDAGYWHLWRFDPRVKAEGKNPFFLDSKEPVASFRDFLLGETRYTTLQKQFPEVAEELFSLAEEQAKDRYNGYVRMTKMEF